MDDTHKESELESLAGCTVKAVEIFDNDGIPTARIHFTDGATLYVDDPTLYRAA